MDKAFQDSQGQTAADQDTLHSSSSSRTSTSSSGSAQGWDQRAQKALDSCRAMFAAVQNAQYTAIEHTEARQKAMCAIRMLHLQLMRTLRTDPEHWFQHAFQLAGQEQLSTACLHPQLWQQQQQVAGASTAPPQQSKARADIQAAIDQVLSQAPPPLAAAIQRHMCGWLQTGGQNDVVLQQATAKHWLHRLGTAYEEWQQTQLQVLSSVASTSPHPGGSTLPNTGSSSSSSGPGVVGNAGRCAAAEPALCAAAAAEAAIAAVSDQLQSLVSEPGACNELLGSIAPLTWQSEWTTSAAVLANIATCRDHLCLRLCALRAADHVAKVQEESQRRADSEQQEQQKQKKAGSAAGKKQKGRGNPAKEGAAAAADSKQPDKHTSSTRHP